VPGVASRKTRGARPFGYLPADDEAGGEPVKIADITTEQDVKVLRARARANAPAAAAEAPAPVRQMPAAPPVELHKIESVTRQIDSFLRSINRSLQFRLDETTGRMVVSICDAETGEVIRQVPGEEALRIAQDLENHLSGMLDEKA
jgi:flagellar protein FlaG